MKEPQSIDELKGRVDFGVITVREDEFEAVLKRFRSERIVTGRQSYSLARLVTSNQDEYLIAVVRCVEQGTVAGHAVAHRLIEDLDPSWILLVGIAGAVPDSEYTLGDVVLASRLHDFSLKASIEDAQGISKQQFTVKGGPMHPAIQNILGPLPALESFFEPWTTREAIGVERPLISMHASKFYGDDAWRRRVRDSLRKYAGKNLVRDAPKAISRPIASSDTLVKDTKLLAQWLDSARHITGVEMELAGVYQAAWDAQKPILAIRGISDIVGYKRSLDWTDYACHTAAAFTLSLLRWRPINPRSEKSEITQPLRINKPPTTGVFSTQPPNPSPLTKNETLYSNLLQLTYVPKDIYTVRTNAKKRGEVWHLLGNEIDRPPDDWVYKGHAIYSFSDFSQPYWKNVCDLETVEANPTTSWSKSNDTTRIAEYIELLKGCLKELAFTRDILYRHRKPLRFLYYAPTPDLSPRIVNTRSLIRDSGAHTVFQAYTTLKTQELRYYRHHAFRFEFHRFAGEWYLEITPTYHYTTDGSTKYRHYQKEISAIKRKETNEAVFRQVLFWAEVLKQDESNFLQQEIPYPYLQFGELLKLPFGYGILDELWKKKDPKMIESEPLFA